MELLDQLFVCMRKVEEGQNGVPTKNKHRWKVVYKDKWNWIKIYMLTYIRKQITFCSCTNNTFKRKITQFGNIYKLHQ